MSERQRNIGPIHRFTPAVVATWMAAPAMLFAFPGLARADGAFPDSQSVLLPADHPSQMVVATTFGLVSSEDNGDTWSLSCESKLTLMASGGMYALGPSPRNRLYAIADVGALASADGGCTWTVGGGDLVALPPPALPLPFDLFADPANADNVYLLAADQDQANAAYYAFRSTDGGLKYSGPIITAPAGAVMTGIEASASSPGTVYITLYDGAPVRPQLATSLDGGQTWSTRDISAGIGNLIPTLAGVDPEDARKIYLRVLTAPGVPAQSQGIALTADGGLTWTTPLSVPKASLTGFARLPNKILLVTGTVPSAADQAAAALLYRSEDGGQSFASQSLAFHPLGLAQRAGTAYIATKDTIDGFALVSSTDLGRSWTPRLRFRDISRLKDCVRASCESSCNALLGNYPLFSPEVCTGEVTKASSGCGCVAGRDQGVRRRVTTAGAALVLVALLMGLAGRRRRARRPP